MSYVLMIHNKIRICIIYITLLACDIQRHEYPFSEKNVSVH